MPEHVRSDNGPEFIAKVVQDWITSVGAKTAYIAPGSPWENGFIESFNARLRDELLDGVAELHPPKVQTRPLQRVGVLAYLSRFSAVRTGLGRTRTGLHRAPSPKREN